MMLAQIKYNTWWCYYLQYSYFLFQLLFLDPANPNADWSLIGDIVSLIYPPLLPPDFSTLDTVSKSKSYITASDYQWIDFDPDLLIGDIVLLVYTDSLSPKLSNTQCTYNSIQILKMNLFLNIFSGYSLLFRSSPQILKDELTIDTV